MNLFDSYGHDDMRDDTEDDARDRDFAALQAELAEANEEIAELRGLLAECQAPLAAHALNSETPAINGKVLALVRRIEVKIKPTAEEQRKRRERGPATEEHEA